MGLKRVPGETELYLRMEDVKSFSTYGMWLRIRMMDGTVHESLQSHDSYSRWLKMVEEG